MKFNVSAVVVAPNNPWTLIYYARETNEIGAAHAVTTILAEKRDNPWDPRLIDIRVEVV